PLPGDAGAEAVGAEVHREVDMLARLGDRADADDVGVLELCGGLAFVPTPALEQRVAGIARLRALDGDGGAVLFPSDERRAEPPLAQQGARGQRAGLLAS